jgi:DNA-binding response OmpR family regulator
MTIKVLMVDDNQDAVFSAAEQLEQAGCEVRVCHDDESAIIEATAFCPDVCVLDLAMPRMGELAEKLINQADHPLRVIALTRLWDITSSHRTRNAGFHELLIKPVDPQHLVEIINDQNLPVNSCYEADESSSKPTKGPFPLTAIRTSHPFGELYY